MWIDRHSTQLPVKLKEPIFVMNPDLYTSFADRLERVDQCNLCGGTRLSLAAIQPKPPYAIQQCKDCSLLFTSPRVREDMIGELYAGIVSDQKRMERQADSNIRRAQRHYRRLKRCVSGGRLLELGAGDGAFLHVAQRDGWEVAGFDYSKLFIDFARTKYGLELQFGDFIDAKLQPESYNAIAAFQTIEHIYDPRAFFKHCHTLLKPKGVLMLSTPNVLSYPGRKLGIDHWKIPQHVFFFTPRTMLQALRNAGLTPVPGNLNFCSKLEKIMKWDPWSVGGLRSFVRDRVQPRGLFVVARKE